MKVIIYAKTALRASERPETKAYIMHYVELDQSGRIEFTRHDTVLAFSDGISYSILIPRAVKRNCINELRQRGLPGGAFYVQLFAVGLYLLLRDHIDDLAQITIDIEFPGRDDDVRRYLMNLLLRAGHKVKAHQIQFRPIGKQSPAHKLALATFRGDRVPDRIIGKEDLLGEF